VHDDLLMGVNNGKLHRVSKTVTIINVNNFYKLELF